MIHICTLYFNGWEGLLEDTAVISTKLVFSMIVTTSIFVGQRMIQTLSTTNNCANNLPMQSLY